MKAIASLWVTVMVGAVYGTVARGAEPPVGEKNEQGLTAQLVSPSGKYTYTLEPGMSGETLKELIEKAKDRQQRVRMPKPPEVALELRIRNTTDKAVTITLGGDGSHVDLKLEGPGALTVNNPVMMTREFREGKAVTIAPGESHSLPVSSLAFGLRGITQHAYWTEPGAYTLTATLVYPVGQGQAKVTSGATKLTVEAAKEKP